MGIDRTDAITGLNYHGDVDVAICTDEQLRADIKESVENLAYFIPFNTFGKIDAARLSLWFIERNADELDRRQPPDDFTNSTGIPSPARTYEARSIHQRAARAALLPPGEPPQRIRSSHSGRTRAHINEIERRIGRWAAHKMGWYITPERKDEFTAQEKDEAKRRAESEEPGLMHSIPTRHRKRRPSGARLAKHST